MFIFCVILSVLFLGFPFLKETVYAKLNCQFQFDISNLECGVTLPNLMNVDVLTINSYFI